MIDVQATGREADNPILRIGALKTVELSSIMSFDLLTK